MSKEIKIAVLVILTLGASIWGYKYIIGKNLLKKSNVYFVDYDNVNRVNISTPVKYLGYQVGFVAAVTPQLASGTIRLTLDLDKTMALPRGSRADILTETFMGSASIILTIPGGCNGDCLPSGTLIGGKNLGILGSMVDKDDLKTYVSILQEGISVLVDSLGKQMATEGTSDSKMAQAIDNLTLTIDHLEGLTGQLQGVMASSGKNISRSIESLAGILDNVEASNAEISSMLRDLSVITRQVKDADAQKTIESLQASLAGLQATLRVADTTFTGVNMVLTDIQAGKGSLGKLVKDDALAENLGALSRHIDTLVVDLQERPYRYIPLKSRRKTEKRDREP